MPDLFGKLKSGAEKVAFEADKMTRANRAQGELGQLKKQIEIQTLKLGELYYQGYQTQEVQGPEFTEICEKIAELEGQVAAKSEEVKRINAEVYAPPGAAATAPAAAPAPAAPSYPAAPGVSVMETPTTAASHQAEMDELVVAPVPQARFCPNCGREVTGAQKFCPDCGTKL